MTARSRFEMEFISSTYVLIDDVAREQNPYNMKMVFIYSDLNKKKSGCIEVVIFDLVFFVERQSID